MKLIRKRQKLRESVKVNFLGEQTEMEIGDWEIGKLGNWEMGF